MNLQAARKRLERLKRPGSTIVEKFDAWIRTVSDADLALLLKYSELSQADDLARYLAASDPTKVMFYSHEDERLSEAEARRLRELNEDFNNFAAGEER